MTARQLQPKGNEGPALHIRPFGAAARRIRRPALIWAVWLECTDADGHVVCETLVGVSSAHRWTRSVSAADIRKRVDESWGHIRKRVDGSRHEIRGLDEALRTATTVAMERERAIARAIEERQARMAATLLQGALFDRRVEREAVAQRALVEQALTRSRARLDELHQRQTIVIASRPAFSLIAW
jgi:hypothetical protein